MHNSKTILTIFIILFIGILLFFLAFKKNDYSSLAYECDKILLDILTENNINAKTPLGETHYKTNTFWTRSEIIEKEFRIPPTHVLGKIKEAIIKNTAIAKFSVGKIQSKKNNKEEVLTFEFYFKKLKIYKLTLKKKIITSKIALVLDDWGYNKKVFDASLDITVPITYAILPNLPYSAEIANRLNKLGHEFILHLPMEPKEITGAPLEENTLLSSMSKEEILTILQNDIANLSGLKGINNHMGSKATENEYLMDIVLDEIKQNKLYFLDSYTGTKSIVEKIAKHKNIPFLKRDVFIDIKDTKKSIKQQLLEAKKISETTGEAIAIGHAKYLTILMLKQIIPQFKKEGIEFVYLSDFLDKPYPNKTEK